MKITILITITLGIILGVSTLLAWLLPGDAHIVDDKDGICIKQKYAVSWEYRYICWNLSENKED